MLAKNPCFCNNLLQSPAFKNDMGRYRAGRAFQYSYNNLPRKDMPEFQSNLLAFFLRF
jgi:hypothetical protein